MALLMLAVVSMLAAAPGPIVVHVTTAGAGSEFQDDQSEKMRETASVLVSKLRGKGYMVSSDAVPLLDGSAPDVLVAVTDRKPGRSETTVKLAVGAYSTTWTRKSRGMIGSGGIGAQSWVAGKLAEEVLDWLAQNKATVQQRREAGKAAATP